jgi:hypothetical protein
MRWLNRVKYIHFAIQFMAGNTIKGDGDPVFMFVRRLMASYFTDYGYSV